MSLEIEIELMRETLSEDHHLPVMDSLFKEMSTDIMKTYNLTKQEFLCAYNQNGYRLTHRER